MKRLPFIVTVGAVAVGALAVAAVGEQRFPPPDFTTGHELPSPTSPHPPATWWSYLDVAMLVGMLAFATLMALKVRSRNGMVVVSIVSLAYFGFFREGCVCAIGSVQNVSLALADPGYAIPLPVLAFFLIPLVFTVLFGRTFCAGVCPLGTIQDLVLLKPVRVPRWLEQALGVVPYVYLGAALLLAATRATFLICRFDPFVGFFRLSGQLSMILFGAGMLLLAVFIGRPYCRFLCPYGAVLRQLSRISARHLTIAPRECIQCRLCHDACPFGAINEPSERPTEPSNTARRRMLRFILALPVLIVAGGWLFSLIGPHLANLHPTVANATQMLIEKTPMNGRTETAFAEAASIQQAMRMGGWLLGGFIGLVIGVRLLRHATYRHGEDYTPDRAACYTCVRCVPVCPKHRVEGTGAMPLPLPLPVLQQTGEAT